MSERAEERGNGYVSATINLDRFGRFLAEVRKEKGITQKLLAESLGVTDKAVSKWERGRSLPDAALLLPLAEALGVSVTELLRGERLQEGGIQGGGLREDEISATELENLAADLRELSREEKEKSAAIKKKRMVFYSAEVFLAVLEVLGLYLLGISWEDISTDVLLVEILPLFFGIWFFFFIKERLPSYYDTEKISFYADGVFRMNMTGFYFNNNNWRYILKCGRLWCGLVPVLYPLLYLMLRWLSPGAVWNGGLGRRSGVRGVRWGGLFIPMVVVGRKYQ